MEQDKNFLVRAFDAFIAGRARAARQYVDRHEREYGKQNSKLTKR